MFEFYHWKNIGALGSCFQLPSQSGYRLDCQRLEIEHEKDNSLADS